MNINFIRDRLEIQCAPITWCNLKCSFCQNKNQWFQHDSSVLSETLDIIRTKGKFYKKIEIGFWGGQVLADALQQDVIQQYDQFIKDVYTICGELNVPVTVDVCSNLIHNRVNWLIKWKKQHNIIISTSFDLAQRFTKTKQLLIFKQNVDKILKQGFNINVNMVAIKPNVQILLKNDSSNELIQYMNQLYNKGVNFEIEYYNDVCGIPEMVVSPKQLADFMVIMYKRYPKFANFYHTLPINSHRQPQNTSSEFIAVYPKGTHIYRYPIKIFDSKKLAKKLIFQKKCFNCQYYGHCAPRQPIQFENGEFCITKHIMDKINLDTN